MSENNKKTKVFTFANDLFLKILSVGTAVIIWFILAFTVNADIKKTIENVPVIIDTSMLESYNLEPINFGEQTVSVVIEGKGYDIANLGSDDIVAKLTPYGVVYAGTEDINVAITSVDGEADFVVSDIYPSSFKVYFDTYIEKLVEVDPQAPYITMPSSGYIITPPKAYPNSVLIRGPKYQVERIDRIVAKTDTKEVITTSKKYKDANIIFYSGNFIEDSTAITYTPLDISVGVEVYAVKTVPLKISFQNVPPKFDVKSLEYTMSQDEIIIIGAKDSIDNISEINLGYVDMRKLEPNNEYKFAINLQEGVDSLSEFEEVTIQFANENYSEQKITISDNNISIIGIPDGYTASVREFDNFDVTVVGDKEILKQLTAEDIVIEVDVSSFEREATILGHGTKIYLPEYNNVWILETKSVQVNMKKEVKSVSTEE